ncbi:MAG: hypothetical protein WCK67_09905 [bacterium]
MNNISNKLVSFGTTQNKIEKKESHPIKNGALIGAGLGVTAGTVDSVMFMVNKEKQENAINESIKVLRNNFNKMVFKEDIKKLVPLVLTVNPVMWATGAAALGAGLGLIVKLCSKPKESK